MIIVFLGPPYAGKGTHSAFLGQKLNIPVFSMGALIRQAHDKGDEVIKDAYERYALKGLNVPTHIKFDLLKKAMIQAGDNFILDNFPATEDDLKVLSDFLKERNLSIDKVLHMKTSEEEMIKRLKNISRGRADDDPEIVRARREIQDKERKPVIEYFKNQGILTEVNSEGSIEEVNRKIEEAMNDSHK